MPDDLTHRQQQTLARVWRRLIPFSFVCYVVAYIDRVNIGFAATELQRDLGLSPTAYGFGAGLFFLAYCLFEIPSNLLLERVGARRWIARILIGWGWSRWATLFVTDTRSFMRRAGPARDRRGWLLPGHGALSDVLGPGRRSRAARARCS